MKESVSEELIQLGINFGFTVFFFGILSAVVCSITNCCNFRDNQHDHGNNNEHVIITIKDCAGIKPSVLRSIHVVNFISQDFKDSVQCVVCLSELADGDKARVLPSCNHWFHAGCIESWFQSHSSCPICRKRVDSVPRVTKLELDGDDQRSEHSGVPTDPPSRTDAAVVEDAGCGQANQVLSARLEE